MIRSGRKSLTNQESLEDNLWGIRNLLHFTTYLLPFSRRKISWSLIPVLRIILEFHVEELFSKTQKQSEVVFEVVLN